MFFFNFLMELGWWWASIGRFWFNWWHDLKELLKTITNRHKCGDTLPKIIKSITFGWFKNKKSLLQNILFSENYVTFWQIFAQKKRLIEMEPDLVLNYTSSNFFNEKDQNWKLKKSKESVSKLDERFYSTFFFWVQRFFLK
jgi:hypothetical protein